MLCVGRRLSKPTPSNKTPGKMERARQRQQTSYGSDSSDNGEQEARYKQRPAPGARRPPPGRQPPDGGRTYQRRPSGGAGSASGASDASGLEGADSMDAGEQCRLFRRPGPARQQPGDAPVRGPIDPSATIRSRIRDAISRRTGTF